MSISTSGRPTFGDEVEDVASRIGTPPIFGPPVAFLLGPWLLLALVLAPPFAVLFTIALVLAVVAAVVAAIGAVLASPFLLVRHIRAHRAEREAPVPDLYPKA